MIANSLPTIPAFTPAILPHVHARSKSIATLLPIPYLNGLSTDDFFEALAALLGKDAPGLSPRAHRPLLGRLARRVRGLGRSAICRRNATWMCGHCLQARLQNEKQCILVLIGATLEGRKELIGFTDGAP